MSPIDCTLEVLDPFASKRLSDVPKLSLSYSFEVHLELARKCGEPIR